jgi:hypothetical protein
VGWEVVFGDALILIFFMCLGVLLMWRGAWPCIHTDVINIPYILLAFVLLDCDCFCVILKCISALCGGCN